MYFLNLTEVLNSTTYIFLLQGADPFGFGEDPIFGQGKVKMSGQACHTVTKRVGNMVTTYTQCS
jgi:hypothetical protein